ncbi:MAG: hypothetical protein IAX21_04460 [Candidatus Bathyarchaeota archaeon]|nr:MAG: hypothetical protein NUK63_01320 [Candidatus Bathyarchaeum tardum]WNZ30108.1 MAG: hypothetical protein IAX21_04460 [Candidatus Bathyarchaeota archaeon]
MSFSEKEVYQGLLYYYSTKYPNNPKTILENDILAEIKSGKTRKLAIESLFAQTFQKDMSELKDLAKSSPSKQNNYRVKSMFTREEMENFGSNILNKKSKGKSPTFKKISKVKKYPKGYYLHLLALDEVSGYYRSEGDPKWWEKRAGKDYTCTICHRSIPKTTRYIGQQMLKPGRKGIYGYKGTYTTRYYHIICILKQKKGILQANISKLENEIQSLEQKIEDLRREISVNEVGIYKNIEIINKKRQECTEAGFFGKISKKIHLFFDERLLTNQNNKMKKIIFKIKNETIPTCELKIKKSVNLKNATKQSLRQISETIEDII